MSEKLILISIWISMTVATYINLSGQFHSNVTTEWQMLLSTRGYWPQTHRRLEATSKIPPHLQCCLLLCIMVESIWILHVTFFHMDVPICFLIRISVKHVQNDWIWCPIWLLIWILWAVHCIWLREIHWEIRPSEFRWLVFSDSRFHQIQHSNGKSTAVFPHNHTLETETVNSHNGLNYARISSLLIHHLDIMFDHHTFQSNTEYNELNSGSIVCALDSYGTFCLHNLRKKVIVI